jgi:tetratricopeptide (TPR) repeat protein
MLFCVALLCLIVNIPIERLEKSLTHKEDQERFQKQFERIEALVGKGTLPSGAGGDRVNFQTDQLSAAVSLAIRSEESYQQHDYKKALELLRYADSLAAIAPIKARIADCYFSVGDYRSAIAFEEQAIKLAPAWSGPYYVLGFSQLRLGNRGTAREAFKKSCELGFRAACEAEASLRQ